MKDILGDRMKAFENVESERRAVIGQPLCARLDGRSFHTFTKGLNRPFDGRLTDLMIWVTKHLVEETNAVLGYTQSDEISLMWYLPEGSESQYLFDGRFQKLASILSAYATGYFIRYLDNHIPEKEGLIPLFDCRVWQVPNLSDAYWAFVWREKDTIKNSITMAASHYFSHKELQGVSGTKKKEMLREIGDPFEDLPKRFKRGSYVQRVKVSRMLTEEELSLIPEKYRPLGPVERNEVKVVELPEIDSRINAPLKVWFPTLFP